MFLFLLGAFIAGMLTVLAPCVLALLPIIIGGSVSGKAADKKRPIIIAVSLAISLLVFTLLLKATTVFINIPPTFFTYISGGIIIAVGIASLFPSLYATLLAKLGIEQRAQGLLGAGYRNKNSILGPIIIGAALGPVFSSCSPVYAYILATILPANFGQAMAYIIAYIIGLSLVLLLIGYFGQRFVAKIKFAADPKGAFQRAIAILFIIIGLLVITGYDKRFQTWVSEHTPFNFDALSAKLIPSTGQQNIDKSKLFNVKPYDAPEFTGLKNWINSEPRTVKGMRGKVVLVDFWTYSCINCIRNNPYLNRWYDKYKDKGLVIVGVHAPEFAFEKIPANVEKAVKDQKVKYPVALDNDFDTWNAYQNQYWPASYLIDKDGKIRRVHYGEGEYTQSENAIRALLQEAGASLDGTMTTDGSEKVPSTSKETPETYLGIKRASNFVSNLPLAKAPVQTFTAAGSLGKDKWTLGGTWEVQQEKIIARGNSTLKFNVSAKEAYVVAGASESKQITVKLDGKPISQTGSAGSDVKDSKVTIKESQLYRLMSHPNFKDGSMLELSVPDGVELNVFTFGS